MKVKMAGLRQFGAELEAIARNKKVLIPVIGVLTIPLMYTAMFLGAFWDPYGKLEELPVAVVNSDEGTVFEGKTMHIGLDFTEELKDNKKFDWAFVSKDEALQGMKDKTYYMAIEIPADFSERTTTLTSEHPNPAKLVYLRNDSTNFLAGQIGNSAVETMKSSLNKEVTEAYTRTVFEQLEEAADGIAAASEGAGRIADGTSEAKTGSELLAQNLGKLVTGTAGFQDGVAKLNDAGKQLYGGSKELATGAEELAGGIGQLAEAGGKLAGGAGDAKAGAGKLADGLAASSAGTDKLNAGAAGLAEGLEGWAKQHPELAEDADYQALLAASKQLAAGAEQSAAGQKELKAGADGLEQGFNGLAAGAETLQEKLGEAGAGARELAGGADQLEDGAGQLAAGLSKLNGSVGDLSSGTKQLENGASEMASGLTELEDGTQELSSKLSDASSQTSDLSMSEEKVSMFAEPIQLDVERMTDVPNYGTGLAPYFLSLGLYVGALLITIVYSVREPAIKPQSGWSWFWSKALTLMVIGAAQALIVDSVLLFALKLEVQNMSGFILFSIATSITYMMIIQFLVATMGNPGRFIVIMILILQLTTSSGTYPVELIPDWLQAVAPWLPMTYSVAGFRDVISSGDVGRMWGDAGVLAIFAGAFALLSFAFFTLLRRRGEGGDGGERGAALDSREAGGEPTLA
ncbi:YhgE/Pip domain-containing protein [Paenibacillus sp. LHD-117]|uniref:YhgE/Pip domain-containing protein n=1 Tax=Paenibacillus sp. LHD-117 TaxID=3071412 RepID=UPI0027E138F5|nr:YhgE/Pip domain-containing protein [Paenibacillus sp. LHD-117]MDQ6423350.1 YhgE/Pip domain-containing protein [Paenibacillus sp. LHD-117]